jgi:hypothetical protein
MKPESSHCHHGSAKKWEFLEMNGSLAIVSECEWDGMYVERTVAFLRVGGHQPRELRRPT